ncbi:undecaprenyl-phosphate glucose phosphotransferase [Flaviaesturariibacter aridisoli]|uniref:Undecaprenyl-phosphate glucose phosphotransferase n=1 Tax=Flaviaesturariibacter aridisoli TaxID=2545761 RepID=A0A4R4DYS5_9BACT|nr:undecaprenyl-phosphate glucose phosphotransferase [Flaviaesturariibacter aridisoli]TCZ69052.1 undecaprenyl-phosphate glucose phosphotransferase [Flaviaesturariibacter aridisoli]
MNRRQISAFQFLFSFLDLAALNIAYVLYLFSEDRSGPLSRGYLLFFILVNVVWIFCCFTFSLYSPRTFFKADIFIKNSAKAWFLFLQAGILYVFFSNHSFSRSFLTHFLLGFGAILLFTRLVYIWISRYVHFEEQSVRRVVILGYNDIGKRVADMLTENNRELQIHGYFEDYNKVQELSLYPILGNLKDCLDYAINNDISEIYSTLLPKDNQYLYELAETAEDNFIRVRFVLDYNLFINRAMHVDFLEDVPVLSLRREPLTELVNKVKKRAFDLTFSLLVIVFLLSWLVPLIALIIRIDSKGPVFFTQNRLGRDKKIIKVFKFRSMKVAEKDAEFKQATKDDDRITRVGRFIRKTSLDELPQFFNVLLGTMSICGPRPHPLKMNDDYRTVINKYMIRHFLKPGITGWAQVNGYRGETKDLRDIQGRIEHDIWYMEHWNFWLDIRIIFLTVYNVIKGEENAY